MTHTMVSPTTPWCDFVHGPLTCLLNILFLVPFSHGYGSTGPLRPPPPTPQGDHPPQRRRPLPPTPW